MFQCCCCCCCSSTDNGHDDTELVVVNTKGKEDVQEKKLTGVIKDKYSDLTRLGNYGDYNERDLYKNDEDKLDQVLVKERIKVVAREFWEEAQNGIAAARFLHSDPQNSFPTLFRLSKKMEFSLSQTSISPEVSLPIVEIYPLSQIRAVKRGAPGVPEYLSKQVISIWLHDKMETEALASHQSKSVPYIGLLLSDRHEQERFYIALSIFQIIGTRLIHTAQQYNQGSESGDETPHGLSHTYFSDTSSEGEYQVKSPRLVSHFSPLKLVTEEEDSTSNSSGSNHDDIHTPTPRVRYRESSSDGDIIWRRTVAGCVKQGDV
eukprot:Blabericola_migrator_1__9946@NODE_54_length_16124_cov_113_894563_g50_i0_p7_GENE_NODE_54_length_16124_cov_113_894563_g50_i0NODE_54_length_16124_cov_113_894563_g50_i0_p7_ORF_typecomplete_len319_score54_24Viral_DNA_bp/PF00747_17/0_15_NODE_54_length_16124_cov_113_894563_g50_i050435999